jgi:hypothetical protein
MKHTGLLLLLLLTHCARKYHFAGGLPREDRAGGRQVRAIPLDSSYHFYKREVYKTTSSDSVKTLKSTANQTAGPRGTLIEIEYLLISPARKNVLYVSTRPDKQDRFYANSSRNDAFLNVYFFDTFHAGEIVAQRPGEPEVTEVEFRSKGGQKPYADRWMLHARSDSAWIESIEEEKNGVFDQLIPVRKALKEPVSFRKIGHYQVVHYYFASDEIKRTCIRRQFNKVAGWFRKPPAGNDEPERHLLDNRMYLVVRRRTGARTRNRQPGGEPKTKYALYFQFDAPLQKGKSATVFFKNARIRYRADHLSGQN